MFISVTPVRGLAATLQRSRSFVGQIKSGERRWDGVESVAVAKALKVDRIDLFTRFVRT